MNVWLNGALVDADDARISPFDHGILVGDGVFETLRIYRGVPFAWRRHSERLRRSAAGLDLDVPSETELRAAADALVAAEQLVDGRLRITVTGGPGPPSSERGPTGPTVLLTATPLVAPAAAAIAVATVPWPRNERGAVAGLKTISYAENVVALAHAQAQGASEALFPNTRGELCEATGSNVMLVRDGVLRTPPESSGCLLGVTRALVLELAARDGIPVEEVALPMRALGGAAEVFLTSTIREVQIVASVDGVAVAAAPGPITTQLRGAWRALVDADPDP